MSIEMSKQFIGLPTSAYVNSHLLLASAKANKVLSSEFLRFDARMINCMVGGQKEDLDIVSTDVELIKVSRQQCDGTWQVFDQSKLYDLEKFGPIPSFVKRRSLSKKGSKRLLDAIVCFWFYQMRDYLPYTKTKTRTGKPVLELVLGNGSSPKSYSIWFKVWGQLFHILLKGSGSAQAKHAKRRVGRTSNKIVAAEPTKKDSGLGSEALSYSDRCKMADRMLARMSSGSLSSLGYSCPGE